MEPKLLFASNVTAAAGSGQITSGPAADKKWIITTLYICNLGAVTGTVSLTVGHPAATDFSLLHTASIAQGETINLGSLVLENGDDLDVAITSVDMDFVAFGYEDDEI